MCQCIFDPQVMVSSSLSITKLIFARTMYNNEPLIRKEEEEELLVRMIATIKMMNKMNKVNKMNKMNKVNKMMNKMIKNTTMTRSLDSGPGGWHSLICICINIFISFNICICNCIFCILNIQCIMYNVYYTWMIRTWWLAPQRNLKPCAILPCSAFL